MPTTKFLMYSFKGGSGRTVTTANVAYILAQEMAKKVLAVDLDIESAGASVLFGLDAEVRDGRCWTVQDVLRGQYEPPKAAAGGKAADGGRKTIEMKLHRADFEKSLWPQMHRTVWPAGPEAAPEAPGGFLKALPAQIILTSAEERKPADLAAFQNFELLLEKIQDLNGAPDILLYDSASGQQETANMGLAQCDVLVVFVRWTRQFVIGTLRFLDEYICTRRFCPRIKRVLMVPTAVPRLAPEGRLAAELEERRKRLDETVFRINQKAGNDFGKAAGWIRLIDPIYECQALKWDDRILLMEGKQYRDQLEIDGTLDDYRRLARSMLEATANSRGGAHD
jgi:MinD-like ATPase involved in chromosome partitioning or flagellar assembly